MTQFYARSTKMSMSLTLQSTKKCNIIRRKERVTREGVFMKSTNREMNSRKRRKQMRKVVMMVRYFKMALVDRELSNIKEEVT